MDGPLAVDPKLAILSAALAGGSCTSLLTLAPCEERTISREA